MMTNALTTGSSDDARAFMSVRRDRNLLKSRRTRNVRISRRIEIPGKLLSSRLARDTATASASQFDSLIGNNARTQPSCSVFHFTDSPIEHQRQRAQSGALGGAPTCNDSKVEDVPAACKEGPEPIGKEVQ